MRYKYSKLQNYKIVIHATFLKIIFISVKYKQMNAMMSTYTTEHTRYYVHKDSKVKYGYKQCTPYKIHMLSERGCIESAGEKNHQ